MARDDTAREPDSAAALLDSRSSLRPAGRAVAASTGATRAVPVPAGESHPLPAEVQDGF